ncbi:hypothetical protein [Pontibacter pamirensis]|uniref:hypothetical protein n=1 Tax=Pontibacter pamirensis TaxID=2562824 RepID=UPI0013894BE0|nr:hypothetical protein [Pontibacter pamirensis]
MRSFFASVTPRDYQYNIIASTIAEALDAFGIPEAIVYILFTGGIIDLIADDAGLYVAVKAAHERLKAAELTTAADAATAAFNQASLNSKFKSELEGFSNLKLAEAKVDFERLKCHILRSCDHYFHSIWSLQLGCQPPIYLQGYESIVSQTPVGFVGEKAAFPLLDPKILNTYFDSASIQKAIEKVKSESLLNLKKINMPTPSLIAEVTLGQCCGCEGYIVNSRAIDERLQTAKARQEEVEADRRHARVIGGDLESFNPCCTHQLSENTSLNDNG